MKLYNRECRKRDRKYLGWANLSLYSLTCVFLISGPSLANCSELTSGEQLYDLKLLKEYEDYGNIALFRFRLPMLVTYAKWYVNKIISHPECDDLDVNVVIEAGSLPVINPYNTSFPENTAIPPSGESRAFKIPKESTSLILESSRVRPGDWFIAVYRKKEDDRIKQQGLSYTCHYLANAMMIYERLTHVETLGSTGSMAVTLDEGSKNVLYKFFVESNMAAVSFNIDSCSAWSSNKTLKEHCPVEMFVQSDRLPDHESPSTLCLHDPGVFTGCSLDVSPALRDTWYYLNVTKFSDDTHLKVIIDITVNATICQDQLSGSRAVEPPPPASSEASAEFSSSLLANPVNFSSILETTTIVDLDNVLQTNALQSTLQTEILGNATTASPTPTAIPTTTVPLTTPVPGDTTLCPAVDPLSVNYYNGSVTKEFFSTQTNLTDMLYYPSLGSPFVASFKLDVDDIGGSVLLYSHIIDMPSIAQNVTSTICLKRDAPPFWNGTSLGCDEHMTMSDDLDANSVASFYYPFPSAGTWYAAQYATCTQMESLSEVPVPCHANLSIEMRVLMTACVANCGHHGRCKLHLQDGIEFYACDCSDGYTGWACTEDIGSSSNFLIQVLFVTLSNIVFLFDAILCLYRHHFPVAVSFLATCFFSTMYHACDSSPVCITDYDTLQFCDFFTSFMSILLILIAMARPPHSFKATLHILGVYVLAFFAQWDRFSLWSIAIPLGSGVLILAISWGVRMYKRRKLYPSWRRWLFFIIPGTLLAILGLTINATLETESNYYIVHSTWHICMGLGSLLLLPPREKPSSKPRESESERLIMVLDNNTTTPDEDDLGVNMY
ncbi:post-GPI attachment to proteins factor 6-like [Lytechinus pictus]|uniref:post-GPI attachment to proteins factor 6-like n=1 Tax=Lytechinus pictus TaxID=7653 RepID=UPI0030BA0181